MKINNAEIQAQGEILEEFEVDGRPAKVVRVKPGDINQEDLVELSENLTDTNFKLLNVSDAEDRMDIKEIILLIRDRLDELLGNEQDELTSTAEKVSNLSEVSGLRESIIAVRNAIGKTDSGLLREQLDEIAKKVYPDHTRGEHVRAYRERVYPDYMKKGQLLAVKIDGRTVAVQAYNKVGEIKDGRSVYEFIKASTVNDPKYRRKGFNTRLKKHIFQSLKKERPVWVGASVNKEHIARFARRGWHVVDMDDSHEAIQLWNGKFPEYAQIMKKQGYKSFYLDTKVDKEKVLDSGEYEDQYSVSGTRKFIARLFGKFGRKQK